MYNKAKTVNKFYLWKYKVVLDANNYSQESCYEYKYFYTHCWWNRNDCQIPKWSYSGTGTTFPETCRTTKLKDSTICALFIEGYEMQVSFTIYVQNAGWLLVCYYILSNQCFSLSNIQHLPWNIRSSNSYGHVFSNTIGTSYVENIL